MDGELDAMTQEDCVDLEGLFGRICALDKCLGRVRTAQDEQKAKLEVGVMNPIEPPARHTGSY